MKFLVDECLSPGLVHIAHQSGYYESTHVNWLGLTFSGRLGPHSPGR